MPLGTSTVPVASGRDRFRFRRLWCAPGPTGWPRRRETGTVAADTSTAQRRQADLEPTAAQRLSAWLKGYHPLPGVPDELFDSSRRPRDHWLAFLGDFAEYPEADFRTRFGLANRHIRDSGASYRIYG